MLRGERERERFENSKAVGDKFYISQVSLRKREMGSRIPWNILSLPELCCAYTHCTYLPILSLVFKVQWFEAISDWSLFALYKWHRPREKEKAFFFCLRL